MTAPPAAATPPRLRDGIVLGPAMRLRGTTVHYVYDPATDWYYRIGSREYFLVSRLDGRTTVEEIGHQYARTFGRRLGPHHWQQLYDLLDRTQLLADTADGVALERLRERHEAEARATRRSPLVRRWPLVNPDRTLRRWAPRLAVLFRPSFVVPILLAIVAAEATLFTNAGRVVADIRQGLGVAGLVLAFGTAWAVSALHELAHGLACAHFGGRVREIGVLWRFPVLGLYCRTDDILLFPARHRVYTAFAGVFAGTAAGVPSAAAWAFAPPGPVRSYAAVLLIACCGLQLINLLPFVRLDGYYILTYALGMADLRADTYRFFTALRRERRAAWRVTTPRDRWIFIGYAVTSLVFAVALTAAVLGFWVAVLGRWFVPTISRVF